MKFIDFKTLKKNLLSNSNVKMEYERLEPEYRVITQIIEKRIRNGMTQGQLANLVGTKQSAISRLESGNYNPTLDFLQKIALALGLRMQINLV